MNASVSSVDSNYLQILDSFDKSNPLLKGITIFIEELYLVNFEYYGAIQFINTEIILRCLLFGIVTYSVVIISSYLLTRNNQKRLPLILAELLNVPLLLVPMVVPSKAFRFFLGVQNFVFAMSIHSRFLDLYAECSVKKKPEAEDASKSSPPKKESSNVKKRKGKSRGVKVEQDVKSVAVSTELGSSKSIRSSNSKPMTFSELFVAIAFFSVPARLNNKSKPRLPDLMSVIHLFVLLFIGDVCSYYCREWIPFNISDSNRLRIVSFIGCLYLMTALEWTYTIAEIGCELFGYSLPPSLKHENPLLSVSVAEFWGTRWNPVIGKQLQDSFYKPLRAIGAPRTICILSCFVGSALLHAMPQLMSYIDFKDTVSILGFFFFQGLSLVVETVISTLYLSLAKRGPKWLSASFSSVALATKNAYDMKNDAKSAFDIISTPKTRYYLEFTTLLLMASVSYALFEAQSISKELIGWITMLIVITVPNIVIIRLKLCADALNELSTSYAILVILVGWAWTVTCIALQMPLFSVPMMTIIEEYSPKSLVYGPILRSIYRIANN